MTNNNEIYCEPILEMIDELSLTIQIVQEVTYVAEEIRRLSGTEAADEMEGLFDELCCKVQDVTENCGEFGKLLEEHVGHLRHNAF